MTIRKGTSLLKGFIVLFYLITQISSLAQHPLPTQVLRGIVQDQVLQSPIEGATVTIIRNNQSVVTDHKGEFRFAAMPVGSVQLLIASVGYKDVFLENIQLNSGKETVLTIMMETTVRPEEEIIIKTSSRKNKPLNEMSVVSARAFSVEETQRYAAAVNDPLRMATAYPGVMTTDDGNNKIIIRGNSPTGLLWRMEGVDIPNPNHFSSAGTSGGGISILSAQLLSNSDFITGAFASEYGNALSGVFDLRLRKGNNEKREYTLQAGILGLNAAAEGPLLPFYKGSYLVNYRYSTLDLLQRIGVPFEGGATYFQDLSFNVHIPTKKSGTFTWFGFGGLSNQKYRPDLDSSKWESGSDRYQSKFISNTGASGITHNIALSPRTGLRSALALSYNKTGYDSWYIDDDYLAEQDYLDHYRTRKWITTTTLNHRFSSRSTFRAGVILNQINFDYFKKGRDHRQMPLKEMINTKGNTSTIQGFAQWQYRPAENLTINTGVHYLHLTLNNSYAIEPRASLRWQVNNKNSLAIGYGDHSQVQAMGVYFAKQENDIGSYMPNKDLGLTKARHYVLSFQHIFNRYLALKAEVYYQQLRQVPVSIYDSSTLSVLNIEQEYISDELVNKGMGRNYGVELSLEQYLKKSFYYTISASLYQSKYKAIDGVERDTRFNGNYLFNMVAGKEFISSDKLRSFGVNVKTIYAGGLRYTPVDPERSIQEGYAVYIQEQAFTIKSPDYFRTDIRLSMKWNRKKHTSTLSLDIQNVSNRLNVYTQYFDQETGKIETAYQVGLIPVLNYKIEF